MRRLYFDPVTDITGAKNRSNETPYDVPYSRGRIELRHFPATVKKKQRRQAPLLLVPPLAGNIKLFDVHPQYSAVRVLQQAGFEQYLLSWGNPTAADRHNSIAFYLDEVAKAVTLIKQQTGAKKVALVGYCLGGILAAFYASRHNDVQCLAVLNSPFNFANKRLADHIEKAFYDVPKLLSFGLISRKHFPVRNTSGKFTTVMYQLSNPAAALKGRIALYRGCLNKQETEVRLSMQEALNMTNYPGQAMQDMIDCALSDLIAEQAMMVNGKAIDLTTIKVPIFCAGGLADATVPRSALLSSLAIFPKEQITTYEAKGGHIGAVFGMGSVHSTWGTVADWITALEKRH